MSSCWSKACATLARAAADGPLAARVRSKSKMLVAGIGGFDDDIDEEHPSLAWGQLEAMISEASATRNAHEEM